MVKLYARNVILKHLKSEVIMQKIICIKNYKNYEAGKDYLVGNNEAYSLIDGGYAKLFSMLTSRTLKGYSDKMMRPKIRRNKCL